MLYPVPFCNGLAMAVHVLGMTGLCKLITTGCGTTVLVPRGPSSPPAHGNGPGAGWQPLDVISDRRDTFTT